MDATGQDLAPIPARTQIGRERRAAGSGRLNRDLYRNAGFDMIYKIKLLR